MCLQCMIFLYVTNWWHVSFSRVIKVFGNLLNLTCYHLVTFQVWHITKVVKVYLFSFLVFELVTCQNCQFFFFVFELVTCQSAMSPKWWRATSSHWWCASWTHVTNGRWEHAPAGFPLSLSFFHLPSIFFLRVLPSSFFFSFSLCALTPSVPAQLPLLSYGKKKKKRRREDKKKMKNRRSDFFFFVSYWIWDFEFFSSFSFLAVGFGCLKFCWVWFFRLNPLGERVIFLIYLVDFSITCPIF